MLGDSGGNRRTLVWLLGAHRSLGPALESCSSTALKPVKQGESGCRPLRQDPEGRQAIADRQHR